MRCNKYELFLDDSIRLAVGQTLQSINNHNQDLLRNYLNIIIPLIFFAMHAEKTQGLDTI